MVRLATRLFAVSPSSRHLQTAENAYVFVHRRWSENPGGSVIG